MRIYNLTWEKYKELKAIESCEACGTSLIGKKHCIDHCHSTGKVRGVLCSPCNLIAGQFESEQGELVIKYLEITNEDKYER